jgi:hypothetical protein
LYKSNRPNSASICSWKGNMWEEEQYSNKITNPVPTTLGWQKSISAIILTSLAYLLQMLNLLSESMHRFIPHRSRNKVTIWNSFYMSITTWPIPIAENNTEKEEETSIFSCSHTGSFVGRWLSTVLNEVFNPSQAIINVVTSKK